MTFARKKRAKWLRPYYTKSEKTPNKSLSDLTATKQGLGICTNGSQAMGLIRHYRMYPSMGKWLCALASKEKRSADHARDEASCNNNTKQQIFFSYNVY